MGEIVRKSTDKNAGGKIRANKKSTRIDMTPMVDLAFLLLTFFILTTTFYKPHMLRLDMPERGNPAPINHENILNLVLAADNKIYWWKGLAPAAAVTDYSGEGVRKLLLESGKRNPHLMVLIKPHDKSRYQNVIDVLDEMVITNMTRYAIVDFTEDDKTRIAGK